MSRAVALSDFSKPAHNAWVYLKKHSKLHKAQKAFFLTFNQVKLIKFTVLLITKQVANFVLYYFDNS